MNYTETKTEIVTPELAIYYLSKNEKNRAINPKRVESYSREMKLGRWAQNGVPIIFADTGRLLDGQHRLQAVIQSGSAVHMAVTRGVDESSFDTIDQGAKREAGQILRMGGVKNSNGVASSCRILIAWLQTGKMTRNALKLQPSIKDIEEVLEAHPEIVDSVRFGTSQKNLKKMMPLSAIGFFKYLLKTYDSFLCEQFFHTLETGIVTSERFAIILKLRDFLMLNVGSRGVSPEVKVMYFARTISHVVNNRNPKILKVVLDGKTASRDPYDIGFGKEIFDGSSK